LLSSVTEDKVSLLAMATDEAVNKGANAGEIIREAVAVLGGKGGGKPSMAQAGGRDASKLPAAVDRAREVLRGKLRVTVHDRPGLTIQTSTCRS